MSLQWSHWYHWPASQTHRVQLSARCVNDRMLLGGTQTNQRACWSGQAKLKVRGAGASSRRGYLAASPQVGGCVDVDYGYDAEVYLQIHLGEVGRQKQSFPAYRFLLAV